MLRLPVLPGVITEVAAEVPPEGHNRGRAHLPGVPLSIAIEPVVDGHALLNLSLGLKTMYAPEPKLKNLCLIQLHVTGTRTC